jgi:hypothetical protein
LNDSFWFEKESKKGNWYIISGILVFPEPEEDPSRMVRTVNNKKFIKIEGSNYELSESQITKWIQRFGTLRSIEEEAHVLRMEGDGVDLIIGTGTYIVRFCLEGTLPAYVSTNAKHPNLLKVKCQDIPDDEISTVDAVSVEEIGTVTGNGCGSATETGNGTNGEDNTEKSISCDNESAKKRNKGENDGKDFSREYIEGDWADLEELGCPYTEDELMEIVMSATEEEKSWLKDQLKDFKEPNSEALFEAVKEMLIKRKME